MQKVFVEKNETLIDILRHVKSSSDDVVMLVIPTESKIKTLTALRGLKKKSLELGKSIIIESVDEKILALATSASLEAIHPFLSNRNNRSMADIIVAPKSRVSSPKLRTGKKPPYILHVKGSGEKAIPIPIRKKFAFSKINFSFPWKLAVPAAILFLVLLGGLAVNVFFTKAEIVINFERTNWELNHSFTASTSVPRDGGASYVIPGQLLKQQKNMAQLFPASGKGRVEQKATTRITIYNAFNTESQLLVVNTRFMTPDGKIFKIDSEVYVPGATRQDGKLVPSSIKVGATASEPGAAYNIGPIAKLSIPGFKGTPRYEGFYGSIEEVASGGFIGERAIATEEDVTNAKQKATEIFKSAFENTFLASAPDGLKLIDGASELRILKLNVDKNTTPEGNFTVLGEAEFRSLAFKEEDLKKVIEGHAQSQYDGTKFESLLLTYGTAEPDFNLGEIVFALKAQGTLIPDFDADKFKSQVLGRSEKEVRSLVLDIPHLADAKISLMPFWAKKVPEKQDKVTVVVR